MAWVNISGTPGTKLAILQVYKDANNFMQISCDPAAGFETSTFIGGGWQNLQYNATSPSISTNAWHQLVFGQNSGTAFFYIDGVNQPVTSYAAGAMGDSALNANALQIGVSTFRTQYMNGGMDEFALWKTVIPIAQLYPQYEEVDAYDINRFQWIQSTPAGLPVDGAVSTIPFGTRVYHLAGNNAHNTVYSTLDMQSWVANTTPAWQGRGYAGAAVLGNRMYIMGGYNASTASELNDVWSTSDGNTWIQNRTADWPARHAQTVMTLGNLMYTTGASTGTSKTVWSWDGNDAHAWYANTTTAPWSADMQGMSGVVLNNVMYVANGRTDTSTHFNAVYSSSNGNTWTQTATGLWAARYLTPSVAYDNKMWLIGGNTYSGTAYRDTWASYDGITWYNKTGPAANFTYAGHNDAAVLNNKMWVGNGSAGNTQDFFYSPAVPPVSASVVIEPIAASFTQSPNPSTPDQPVTFTDTSTGSPIGWNWSLTGAAVTNSTQNASYIYPSVGVYNVFLNVTNSTGAWSNTSQTHTVANATGFVQQDVWMTGIYTLRVHVQDTTGTPIPDAQMIDSGTGASYTTANGTIYASYPFQAVVGVVSSAGYQSRQFSVFVDGDTETTVTLAVAPTNQTPTQSTWYTPWQVRIQIQDYYSNPVPDCGITASYIASSLPNTSTSWLTSAYGITAEVANQMTNSSVAMSGQTDDNGGVSFTMFKSLEYQLLISNATAGISATKKLYPSDQEYRIRVALPGQAPLTNNLAARANTSLPVYQLNASAYNLSVIYQDTSGQTTNVRFQVKARNGTVFLDQDLGNPGTGIVSSNYTILNQGIGQEVIWMYNATRT